MARLLETLSQREYRHQRSSCPPGQAVLKVIEHFQFLSDALGVLGAHGAQDMVNQEIDWLNTRYRMIRLHAAVHDRLGNFWRTGKYRGPLIYTVTALSEGGLKVHKVECDNPGCAVKHGMMMLTHHDVQAVRVTDSWSTVVRTFNRHMTVMAVNRMFWDGG